VEEVSTIGLDIAKQVFHAHGADASGVPIFSRRVTRAKLIQFFASQPRCVVAMEACAGAHHWGRELQRLGHEVRLIPPAYVKPFVKRQKNDAADAQAICEAAQRPTMRFVPVKSEEQQASAAAFRARDLLVRQRTQLLNALRGLLAEHGWAAPRGLFHASAMFAKIEDPSCELPPSARDASTDGKRRLLRALQPTDRGVDRSVDEDEPALDYSDAGRVPHDVAGRNGEFQLMRPLSRLQLSPRLNDQCRYGGCSPVPLERSRAWIAAPACRRGFPGFAARLFLSGRDMAL
jgi:transposase